MTDINTLSIEGLTALEAIAEGLPKDAVLNKWNRTTAEDKVLIAVWLKSQGDSLPDYLYQESSIQVQRRGDRCE